MKTFLAALVSGILCLGGCSTPVREPANAQASQSKSPAPPSARRIQPPASLATRSAPSPEALTLAEPDAVVKLDPGSERFTPEMDGRLSKIAAELNRDDRILVRLKSHVPGGGSSALDIGIADMVLHKVKERLQALGVSSRRMLLASFGREHSLERDPKRHWVEIYLIRPGTAAVEAR
ncbi:MAG: hypothetical protein NDI67_02200 [Sulfuritalea sp.]|nr:hypothetical protein [Sulfuritalea sp.]